jgi:hypothetical protein
MTCREPVDSQWVSPLRPIVAVLAVAALFVAPSALACGVGGYSYAGVGATAHAFGIGAVVTPVSAFNVVNGHVAGWVGVGGPGEGPGGSDEWIQAGLSGFAGVDGASVYYEVTRAGGNPTYHQVTTDLPLGKPVRVAVLEMHGRPNWWRVWVNGSPVSNPVELPGSHGRWSPIATAESWDGNTGGMCNGFLYRFDRISVAGAPGGGWSLLHRSARITSTSTKLRQRTTASFYAAEGNEALRTLASLSW